MRARYQLTKKSIPKRKVLSQAQIEKLLGEDFDSLKEARKAFAEETEKHVNLNKKWYSIHDFPVPKGVSKRNHLEWLVKAINENDDMLDAKLRPDEIWGLEVRNKKTYLTGKHIGKLIDSAVDSWELGIRGPINAFVDSIKIVQNERGKFREPYKVQRRRGLAKQAEQERRHKVDLKEKLTKQKTKLVSKHEAEQKKLKDQLKKLKQQLKAQDAKKRKRL